MSLAAQPCAAGDQRQLCLVENLTRTQIVQYAGASGDYNPLHSDEPFARDTVGLPGVFAHGMLTMGMSARLLTDWFEVENLASYGARFAAQVWPGDTLTARAVIDDIRIVADGSKQLAVSLTTTNQRDEIILTANAVVRLPGDR